jgi:hypothetical protein
VCNSCFLICRGHAESVIQPSVSGLKIEKLRKKLKMRSVGGPIRQGYLPGARDAPNPRGSMAVELCDDCAWLHQVNLCHDVHPSFKAVLSSKWGPRDPASSAFIRQEWGLFSSEKMTIVDLRCVVMAKTGRKWDRDSVQGIGRVTTPSPSRNSEN